MYDSKDNLLAGDNNIVVISYLLLVSWKTIYSECTQPVFLWKLVINRWDTYQKNKWMKFSEIQRIKIRRVKALSTIKIDLGSHLVTQMASFYFMSQSRLAGTVKGHNTREMWHQDVSQVGGGKASKQKEWKWKQRQNLRISKPNSRTRRDRDSCPVVSFCRAGFHLSGNGLAWGWTLMSLPAWGC